MLIKSQNVTEKSETLDAMIEMNKQNQNLSTDAEFNIELDNSEESLRRGQENFLKKANYNRIQNGKANFENVQLLDLDGNLISEVFFGQEVILRMTVKICEDLECLGMGYHIRNSTGIDLVYTDSRFNKTKAIFDAKRGESYIIDWKFKVELTQQLFDIACVISLPIDAALTRADICDFVPCALQFNVTAKDEYGTLVGGYVHWHSDLRIINLGKQMT